MNKEHNREQRERISNMIRINEHDQEQLIWPGTMSKNQEHHQDQVVWIDDELQPTIKANDQKKKYWKKTTVCNFCASVFNLECILHVWQVI